MVIRGNILDEFGDRCGQFWFREGQGTYHLRWGRLHFDGWTLEGIYDWASRLEYQVEEVA